MDHSLSMPPTPGLGSLSWILPSKDHTLAFGQRLGQALQGGDVLALTGELGAGKTLLTHGMTQGLGFSPGQVNSPTFSLIQVYEGLIPVVHVDLYRLENPVAIQHLGLEDYFIETNIVIIEWADRFIQILPPDYLEIHLEHGETENTRILTLRTTGTRSHALASILRTHTP